MLQFLEELGWDVDFAGVRPDRHWNGWGWLDFVLMLSNRERSSRSGGQWILDDLEFGSRVAFEWVEQPNYPADQRVQWQVHNWELCRWLDFSGGRTSR